MTGWKIEDCRKKGICYLCDLNGKKNSPAAFSMKLDLGGDLGVRSITVCETHGIERGPHSEGLGPL